MNRFLIVRTARRRISLTISTTSARIARLGRAAAQMGGRAPWSSRLGLCLMLVFLAARAHAATATEAWVRRYSYPAHNSDEANKVVTDNTGNVIVAGSTYNEITGSHSLTIKYSGAGVPLWTNRYDGLGSAIAVAVDSSGNVIVTGSSSSGFSNYDYTTIKYSGAGVPLWTNRYSGPGNSPDQAYAVAVDNSGNVFVTGQSGSDSAADYVTVAYSGTGVLLWTRRYNGPGNSEDRAQAVTVDGNGNVLVTGYSYGQSNSYYDYATIKYSGTGVPLWTNRYDGDAAYALAADGGGNVFVTGVSWNGSSEDYATVAYSGAGVPLWTNHYDGLANVYDHPFAVAVDDGGNVFVTGQAATVAYSGGGIPLWTNRYDGYATAMAADGSGNVFVTGWSWNGSSSDYATVAYSGGGIPLWTNRHDGYATAMAADGSGNVFVTGRSTGSGGSSDWATVAYSGAGVPLWTNRYDELAAFPDSAAAVAVTASGNVVVTGNSRGEHSSEDYATVAYSGTGVPLWTNRYDGPGEEYVAAMAVDSSGNVFVAGSSAPAFDFIYDYATVAYSSAGVPLWTNRYEGPGNADDEATGVAVDGSGNVFVTGYSWNGSSSDYATVAYSGGGIPLWTNRHEGLGFAMAVAVDGGGNVFVTGSSWGGSSGDYVTVAYSGEGVPLWTNRYSGAANSDNVAIAMAVDGSGNVVVTGRSGRDSAADYATVAYSGAGLPLWTNRYGGPANSQDVASAVAVDRSGNVFVTGSSWNGSSSDSATVAYSGGGLPLWTNRYNGGAHAVAVDGNGNVVVTGGSLRGSSGDYATVAYSGTGVPLWTNFYNGPANRNDSPQSRSCLAIGPDGAVYVTGTSEGNHGNPGDGTDTDYATVKYVWRSELAIEPLAPGSPNVNLTLSGAPNSTWSLERALAVTGPWTNLGTVLLPANGVGPFQDTQRPASGAFYRARQP